ncbi:hypothetical protein KUTeg_018979, partial [Tegillarca granosa]
MTIDHYEEFCSSPRGPSISPNYTSTTSVTSSKQSMSSGNHLSPGLYPSCVRTGSFRETSQGKPLIDNPNRRGSLPASSPNLLAISTSYDDVRENRENKDTSIRRVRSFKTTPKGVVNRGDSFRKKGARCGQYTRASPPKNKDEACDPTPVQTVFSVTPDEPTSYFKVLVLGAPGVGKTSLSQQFMTSEYTAFDNSMDHDEESKSVSVLLNGEESTLELTPTLLCFLSHIGILALEHDAKYTETSAAVNHHVDDLLVGLLSQIRYKLNPSLPEP